MTKNLNIRIDNELLIKYQEYCNDNGYSVSKRLRNFIMQELKPKRNAKKINK